MQYIEYPKALYKGGELVTVHTVEEDEAAHADGFTDWTTDHKRMNGKADEVPVALPVKTTKKKA